ncbi:hypothetical protein [uncultured Stenotrophomonas sp.]|uniref:hypothetical protein n=1 Tax=uncultured Stenotrophomonas sp. TaxID=165438 RepID=UPI0025E71456|nr:hypothetical protein [uncultured Stenotrophomonas sp.]
MKWMTLGTVMAAAAIVSPTAHAALASEYYQQAREQAPHHLQLQVTQVTLLRGQARGNCEVEATVLRDFRGALEKGSPLRFTLNCIATGVRPMPGPNAWHDYQTLKASHFMEGFFRGAGADIAPAFGQLAQVASEREWPWCEAQTGRCDLPPPSPPLVLECSIVGIGVTGKQVRSGWIIKIADHRMWFWSDIKQLHAGEGRHWQPHLWEPQRTPSPLQVEGDRYTQVSHLYSEGGEQLLMTRTFIYKRSTGEFEERHMAQENGGEDLIRGTCLPIADPEKLPVAADGRQIGS